MTWMVGFDEASDNWMRETVIARNLKEQVEMYVNSTMAEDKVRSWCSEEAMRMKEENEHGHFLLVIGNLVCKRKP